MKFILFVTCAIGFVQVCSSAAIGRTILVSMGLDGVDDNLLESMRNTFKTMKTANRTNVDIIINAFKKFRSSSTTDDINDAFVDLLGVAAKADLSKMKQNITEVLSRNQTSETTSEQLKSLEEILSADLTPSQTEKIIDTVQGIAYANAGQDIVVSSFELSMDLYHNALGMSKRELCFMVVPRPVSCLKYPMK